VSALPALGHAQQDVNPVVRVLATAAVARIKGTPETAVAGLMEQLRNKSPASGDLPWWVRRRFEGPCIFKALGFTHRQAAAWLLGDLGPQAQAAVPLLTDAMSSGDAWLRPIAARAVYRITGQAQAVLPTVLNSVWDGSDDSIPFLALQALGEMGTNARPAFWAVAALLPGDLNIRQAATPVLHKIDPGMGKPARH